MDFLFQPFYILYFCVLSLGEFGMLNAQKLIDFHMMI